MKKFVLASLLVAASTAANAAPIAVEGTLTSGVTAYGATRPDNLPMDYWHFFATAGDVITIRGDRLDFDFDMSFGLFSGALTDDAGIGACSGAGILECRDDEIPHAGPYGDPLLSNYLVTATGFYTVQVWSFASGSDTGNDRFFDYSLLLSGANDVPEPAAMALFGLGLAGLAAARRRRRA